ncbi:MAG: hypothetical protein AAFQ17_05030, partial [Pseudomonadota bacterium]
MSSAFLLFIDADRNAALTLAAALEARGLTADWCEPQIWRTDREATRAWLDAAGTVLVLRSPESDADAAFQVWSERARHRGMRRDVAVRFGPAAAAHHEASLVQPDHVAVPPPLPVGSVDLIASIVRERAEAAEAVNAPSGVGALKKLWQHVTSETLTLIGAAGTALSVLSGLQDLISLSAWADVAVSNFTTATMSFWSVVFSWLAHPIRPIDASLLNLALFLTLFTLSTLAPLSRLPRRLRDMSWLHEAITLIGTLVATALIVGASAGTMFQTMGDPTYMALLDVVAQSEGPGELEIAGRNFMAYASAFFPVADSWSVTLGLASGGFDERLGTVMYV